MERRIHFISGLPKSGGSLLGELLSQDPDVSVTNNNTACHEALYTVRNNWNSWREHKNDKDLNNEVNLQRVLNNLLYSYCISDNDIHFDKGRSWLSLLEMAEFALGRQAKVIVPVRTIKDIAASYESEYRENAHKLNPDHDYYESLSVEGRTNHLISKQGLIGCAYTKIQDAIQRGFGNRMFLVDYNDLITSPEKCMGQIWDWLEMDAPKHDFSIINESRSNRSAQRILGSDVCEQIDDTEFWRKQPSQQQTK
jgi:sulfotransferase